MERCGCDRVPVLCGCGWGLLAVSECDVPEECPLCGFNFWDAFGCPPLCVAPGEEVPAEAVSS